MREHYENLDALRVLASAGIILMHVKANGNFGVTGFVYERVISSFTNFTLLFMVLSAFSMCCGYYLKFKNNSITLEEFYKRRYRRIWPCFALLCTIELIVEHSLASLYEWFADLTLAFGLLPNAKISVIGVGWFLGTVFAFYMMFPFFVFICSNKKRAWFAFAVSIILNFLCRAYFFDENHIAAEFGRGQNIIYSSMFFISGGLLYLHRDIIKNIKSSWLIVLLAGLSVAFYYVVDNSVYTMLVLFSLITACGIAYWGGGYNNASLPRRIIRFLAGISMEIYLCHMFVFRALEKLNLLHLANNETFSYIIASSLTLGGAVLMAALLKRIIDTAEVSRENLNG